MNQAKNIFHIVLATCFILAAVCDHLVTTEPPDGLISITNDRHSTSVKPTPNITDVTATIVPKFTQNSPTAETIPTNSSQNGTVVPEPTVLPPTRASPVTSQPTTLQPSTNSTATSTTMSTTTSKREPTTANASSTSRAPHPESPTTESPHSTQSTTGYSITQDTPGGLSDSERNMTIFFGVLIGVAVLVIFMYSITRCKRKTQYSHRPLYNNSEETVDRFVAADDTLVISGGLYDGPRIYNPTMSTLHQDEFSSEPTPFPTQPTQFRLEFMSEDQENKSPDYGTSTFETFQQPVVDDS